MISVEHLTKYYGEHLAVNDISFEITDGHVYGFLGPNGAGKSTTMNIMTGCLSATSGKVLIDGYDIFEEPNEAKKQIGYLPEHPPLYMNESPLDYLRFVAEAKGLRGKELTEQIRYVMEKTGIEPVMHRRIATLSKGYRQRVGIAQALLGNPKVIILDEPTVGLDPIQIIEIRTLIRELGKDHTVIFSSHILSEVQAICDRILMIVKGKLVAFGTPEELQRQLLGQGEIVLTTNASEDVLRRVLRSVEHITEITAEAMGEQEKEASADGAEAISAVEKPTLYQARIQTDQEDMYDLAGRVYQAFAASNKILYEMSIKKGNLEEVFLELSELSEEALETEVAAE